MGLITRLQDPESGEVKDMIVLGNIPFCDMCGEGSEVGKVHELDLCAECADFYLKQYPKFLDVCREKITKKKKEKK